MVYNMNSHQSSHSATVIVPKWTFIRFFHLFAPTSLAQTVLGMSVSVRVRSGIARSKSSFVQQTPNVFYVVSGQWSRAYGDIRE